METVSDILIHRSARNYLICLADFPPGLKPEHLDVPASEQPITFDGLHALRSAIQAIYDYFAHLPVDSERWFDREYCYQSIEGVVKLLWAMGTAGQLTEGPQGPELLAGQTDLHQALKAAGVRNIPSAFEVLEAVGFQVAFRDVDGQPRTGGLLKSASAAIRYPGSNEPLLRALAYYAARLPRNKATQKGTIFEVFLRADFRPLLPGYKFRIPHLPAEEEEITRTFTPEILAVWRAITGYMAHHHPKYRLFFRVPRVRGRGWVADYSTKDNDYGLWSIIVEEDGLYVRIVMNDKNLPNLFAHMGELSPHFQETYLNSVGCKDCVRCGRHVFYTHGNHVHRLCKSPWYFSPYLRLEDLPDIKRLIDIRMANP